MNCAHRTALCAHYAPAFRKEDWGAKILSGHEGKCQRRWRVIVFSSCLNDCNLFGLTVNLPRRAKGTEGLRMKEGRDLMMPRLIGTVEPSNIEMHNILLLGWGVQFSTRFLDSVCRMTFLEMIPCRIYLNPTMRPGIQIECRPMHDWTWLTHGRSPNPALCTPHSAHYVYLHGGWGPFPNSSIHPSNELSFTVQVG